MQSLQRKANRQTATKSRRMSSLRKRKREHRRLQKIGRRLGANHALQRRLRHLGTLAAGAAIGHRAPKREQHRLRKTPERTLIVILLHRGVVMQMTGTVFPALTGAAKDPPRAIDEMLRTPRLPEKGEIPGVIVVAAAIATLGDHGADQSDQFVDGDQGVGQSGKMTGGEAAALRVLAVTTTHLTGDQDRPAGGVLIEQIDVTHQGRLDGDGRDLNLACGVVQGRGLELGLGPGQEGETVRDLSERGRRVQTGRENDLDRKKVGWTAPQHTSTRRRKKPGNKMRSRSESARRRHI